MFFKDHLDQADCKNGPCTDYRSRSSFLVWGHLQVVYNAKEGRGYLDRDIYSPHGSGILSSLGHIFAEGLANAGGGAQNISGVTYGGFCPDLWRSRW